VLTQVDLHTATAAAAAATATAMTIIDLYNEHDHKTVVVDHINLFASVYCTEVRDYTDFCYQPWHMNHGYLGQSESLSPCHVVHQ